MKNMRLPSAISKTPHDGKYRTKQNVIFLKVFGCKAYAFLEKQFWKKFDCTAREEVFLGFSDNNQTYDIGVDKGDGNVKVLKNRSVKFDEDEYFAKPSSERKHSFPKHSKSDVSLLATKPNEVSDHAIKLEPRSV